MNCFNNNRPKLSASERIKNKKSQAIFKANVIDFQKRNTFGNGKCSNYSGTVGFYNNGKLRKTNNYETLKEINRGSALCVDGTYKNCVNLDNEDRSVIQKGLNACSRSNKVKITSGRDNIYTNFNGLSLTPVSSGNFFSGFPSMVSYYFGGTTNTALNQLAQGFEISMTQTDPSKSTIIIDPSNNLFGTDFCPTDMTNLAQGPNKYLAFADVNSYVVAEGYIYDTDGNLVTCESSDDKKPQIYDLAITGLFSLMNVKGGYSGDKANLVKELPYKYFTGIGFIFKTCCETGPNGEPNWWKIYIRPLLGFFKPPQLLPESIIVPNSTKIEEVYVRMSYNTNSQNLSGTRYTQGGIYETGSLSQYAPQNVDKNAAPPYGGGIGFVKKEALINLFSTTNVAITAMMGWKGTWTGQDPSGFSKTELIVIQGAGDPCKRDLSSGNNTQQNYLVSYTPVNSGIRFNIDPQIYGSSSFKIASNDNSTNTNVVSAATPSASNVISNTTDLYYLQSPFFTSSWLSTISPSSLSSYPANTNIATDTSSKYHYTVPYSNGKLQFPSSLGNGETIAISDSISEEYRWIALKMHISTSSPTHTITFRNSGALNIDPTNGIPIQDLLERNSDIFDAATISSIFATSYNHLGYVYAPRISSVSTTLNLIGNFKINNTASATSVLNWLQNSAPTTLSYDLLHNGSSSDSFGSINTVDSKKYIAYDYSKQFSANYITVIIGFKK